MMKLGLLEFGLRQEGTAPTAIIEDVINYATKADKLGFSRFWLTEHHNLSPAWNSPEMLLPIIAGLTSNIRIGQAGVLLSLHSPYRVALNFKLLSALFPDRIDLGFANGGTAYRIAQLLSNDEALPKNFQANFNQKIVETVQFLRLEGAFMSEHVIVTPHPGSIPEIWNLRSNYENLPLSLDLEINFSRSLFHSNMQVTEQREKLLQFREEYYTRYHVEPRINFTFAGICLKDSQKAKQQFDKLGFESGKYPYNCIIGSPAYFLDQLNAIKENLGVDEFIFHNLSRVSKDRITGLTLLSNIFNLKNTSKKEIQFSQ